MSAKYQISKIDNTIYCITNGQFTRHLKAHNLTYRQYYEQYVTGISPMCSCGKALTFYQHTHSYAQSCGSPVCVGKTVSKVRKSLPDEVKKQQSANYRAAQLNKSQQQRSIERKKKKETYLKNYGVEWSTAQAQKDKAAKSKLDRYGDATYNNSSTSAKKNKSKPLDEKEAITAKRRATNLKRYGVENPLMGSARATNKGNASIKNYVMPSGKIVGIRGAEPIALDMLFQNGISESEIQIHDSYQPNNFTFDYIAVNRHHSKYYPDIYIQKENKVIEVKSRWWWDGNGAEKYKSRLENNLRKRAAVVAKGYIYEVWLFDSKKTYRVLKDDADFQA